MIRFILALFLCFASYADIKKSQLESLNRANQISLRTLEKRIRAEQEEVTSLQEKIRVRNEKLTVLNDLYAKKQLNAKPSDKSKKKMLNLLQLSMADSDNLESLAEQSILIDRYKKNNYLKNEMTQNEKLLVAEKKRVKSELAKLRALEVNALESLKKLQKQKVEVLAQVEVNKLEIQERITQKRLEDALQSPSGNWKKYAEKRMFIEPVVGYLKYETEDKGLEFECLEECKVVAPATGHVVYIGDLAPYGKIIMIAHTQGFRSVFLGNMSFQVKKSQKVYQGNLLAKVEKSPLAEVYFELRKNSQPQEVFNFISFL